MITTQSRLIARNEGGFLEGKILERDGRINDAFFVGFEKEGDSLANVLDVGFFVGNASRVDTFSICNLVILNRKGLSSKGAS